MWRWSREIPPSLLVICLVILGPGVSGAVTIPVANFDSRETVNLRGGNSGCWECDPNDESQYIRAEFVPDDRSGAKGYSLRLEYDIDSVRTYIPDFPNTAFNGYFSLLENVDATGFSYLIFWARGDAGFGFPRQFRIELKDRSNTASYLVEGITSKWKRFVIRLSQFREITRFDQLRELTVVFDQNVNRKTGAIVIDDIYFSKTAEPPLITVSRLASAPVIDGDLSEWEKQAIQLTPEENLEKGKATASDCSAIVHCGWTADALYVGVRVKDDEVISAKSGSLLWQDDCVEVYVDPDCDGLEWGGKSDWQFGFSAPHEDGTMEWWNWFGGFGSTGTVIGLVSDARREKDGYTIEMRLPWPVFGIDAGKGTKFGLTVAVHDCDFSGTPEAKLISCWLPEAGKFRLGNAILK